MDLLRRVLAMKAATRVEVAPLLRRALARKAATRVGVAPMQPAVATTGIPRRIQAVLQALPLAREVEALGSASQA